MSMWTSCLLLIMLMTTIPMVTSTTDDEMLLELFADTRLDDKENRMRWDALQLQAISNPVKERDVYLFRLWEQYKNQSISKRPTMAKEITDAVTKVAYLDSRIDMIGFLLFGPRKGWSVLRAVTYKNPGDSPGFEYMLDFFEEHCGSVTELGMKKSLANIYKYAIDKDAIHEAIILACSLHKTETYSIDVTNPKLNITPGPVHGTFEYCSRVSVTTHAKTYQIKVVPSKFIPPEWHSMVHICFHRNNSMKLCQCEKDGWRSIQRGYWSSVIPLYEQRFVDVKFIAYMPDFVTVTLDEVSPAQRWHYGFLAGAIALLIMAASKAQILSLKKLWPCSPLGQAAALTSCVLLLMRMLIPPEMVSVSEPPLVVSPWANGTRWEPLETTASQIHIEDDLMIRVEQGYRYDLWNRYTSSSRSQRAEIVNEISDNFKQVAFWDTRLDMVGLILFGLEKGRLLLSVGDDKRPELLVGPLDFMECAGTLHLLLEKHCGPPCFNGLRHKYSMTNLCHMATMEAIEEAVILSCGMNAIEPGNYTILRKSLYALEKKSFIVAGDCE